MRTKASRLTPVDDDYPTCERTFAEFRIYGRDLDPALITSQLGLEPTSTQRRDQVKRNSLGLEKKFKIGGWFLSTERQVNSKDIRKHLDWLLHKLTRLKDQIRTVQNQPDIVMTVHCVWWSVAGQGGPTLWPEQMRLLAELNLECGFEIAFFGDEEGS